jgi:hypothetical protein
LLSSPEGIRGIVFLLQSLPVPELILVLDDDDDGHWSAPQIKAKSSERSGPSQARGCGHLSRWSLGL